MKKTMLALMATVGLAFGAKAEVLNSTGFESYTGNEGVFEYDLNDSGVDSAPRYWVVTNTAPDLDLSGTVLTAYGEGAKPEKVPDAFKDAATTNTYLKVDTSNEVLYRSVEAVNDVNALNAGTAIGDGLYFDANVQFTASDAEPDYDSADKLIVWLYNDETAGTTNLMITAAVGQDSLGNPTVITNFVTSATVNADTWYRLTVKALKDNSAHTCFQVYVNENLVEATYNEETISTFYSMVRSSGEGLTISAVGFKGTGAVDNLVWTTEDPFPVVPPTTVDLTVSVTGEDSYLESLTYKVNNGDPVTYSEATKVVADVDDEITLNFLVDEDFSPSIGGETLTPSGEVSEEYYPYTFTVTVDQEMIENGLTLTINVTENGGGDVPEEAKVDPAGGSVTVKAANEEAAAAAVTAKGVDGTVYPASQKYYNKTVTPNGDNWDVTVTLNTTALEEDVDAAVAAALEDLDEAEVALPAGFYYMVESGTDVSISTKAYGTSTGAKIEIGGLGENAGFFKVSVDTTNFDPGE